MVGHGTWNQPAGTTTDDTDQAFDPADIANSFVAWYETNLFDIGNLTRQSISALKQGHT